MREPLTACWPTQATIWQMLMVEPLEPHSAMMSGLLWRGSCSRHTLPATSRTRLSTPRMLLSSVCSAVQPGSSCSAPSLNCAMRRSHSAYPSCTCRSFSRMRRTSGVTSAMPMLKPRVPSQRALSLASRFMALAATEGA